MGKLIAKIVIDKVTDDFTGEILKANFTRRAKWIAVAILLACEPGVARQVDFVVDQHGNGHFATIQGALDAVRPGHEQFTTIFIRDGTYHEKLFVTKSFIALVGESRDGTRIVYPELRSEWIQSHNGDDWGSAVINIGDNVSDVILGNLTVHNNYGSLHGTHDHQFAIRGFKATRISLLYCTVIADGGDTVSLWDTIDGMYYHAFCSFEGWVDYVCPRGWCYITDSRFFGHNKPSASIWHDGSRNKSQKFVIRNSFFDGVEGFPLGRHHKDAQFYLLDCTFSQNMADRPIHSPKSPSTLPWIWGSRHYFHNCRREGGDYQWFSDNLDQAESSPDESQITSAWTFEGRWDPEQTLPSVLPFAAMPQPRNDAYDLAEEKIVLEWIPGRGAQRSKVFLAASNPPKEVAETSASQFTAVSLESGTEYYWRIDTMTEEGTIPGHVWRFRTRERPGQERGQR